MKRYLPFVVVLTLVALVLIVRFGLGGNEDSWLCDNGQWVRHGHPAAPMPSEGCGGTVPTLLQVSLAGRLVQDNPGLKPGIWYVISEKPGAPALTTELSLNASSSCTLGGIVAVCDPANFSQGQWVIVNGAEGVDALLVSSLLDESSSQALSKCPEYVNCMPGPDVNRTCVIPPGCENYTQKAY